MNVPFQDTKYFKRNKIEILVSVCSRHHGTFKHDRRHDRLVLHQQLIHIVDVVTVQGSSGGSRQVSGVCRDLTSLCRNTPPQSVLPGSRASTTTASLSLPLPLPGHGEPGGSGGGGGCCPDWTSWTGCNSPGEGPPCGMMIPPARLGHQEAGEAEETEVGGWAHYYHDWVEAAGRGGMF